MNQFQINLFKKVFEILHVLWRQHHVLQMILSLSLKRSRVKTLMIVLSLGQTDDRPVKPHSENGQNKSPGVFNSRNLTVPRFPKMLSLKFKVNISSTFLKCSSKDMLPKEGDLTLTGSHPISCKSSNTSLMNSSTNCSVSSMYSNFNTTTTLIF